MDTSVCSSLGPFMASTYALVRSVPGSAILLVCLVVLFTPEATHAQIYVDANVTGGANDGSSWTDAFSDLQSALDIATGSDQVWIAQGTYTPTARLDSSDPRSVTFYVTGDQDGIKIYGGFASGDAFSDRSADDHPVILSGDLNGDDSPDSDGDGIPDSGRDENAYHVLVFNGGFNLGADIVADVTSATVLGSVTITGGNASRSGSANGDGGGLFCDGQGSAGIVPNRNECSPTLTGVTFTGNSASDLGGAIYSGGGFSGTSNPVIIGSTFTGNSATGAGGAVFNEGTRGESSPVITGSIFTGNFAGSGGAVFNQGNRGESSPVIIGSTFTSNTANGGAFSGVGGAMYNGGNSGTSSPAITGSTFTGNSANDAGGAVYNAGGPDGVSSPTIIGSTFTGNTAGEEGGAIYNRGDVRGTSIPEITNTILWGNTASDGGDEIFNIGEGATPTLAHTLIEGGISGISENVGSFTADGGGNLNAAPLFADVSDPDGPDNTPATADDGLRLRPGSPALDAGNNNALPADIADLDGDGNTTEPIPFDITGMDRIRDNNPDTPPIVDLGAYEAPADVLIPVELTSFTATSAGEQAIALVWQTASETNNAGFDIERRVGNSPWTTLQHVSGAGTTAEATNYRFEDTMLPYVADTLAYRLRQLDIDGSESLSSEVMVTRGLNEVELLGPYPNPARSKITVRFAVPKGADDARLVLYDLLGRTIRQKPVEDKGRQMMTFDTERLASGVYFLRLTGGGQIRTEKVSVVR